jgi:hypothetical protein
MAFRVGQKVVVVDARNGFTAPSVAFPIPVGSVCTITYLCGDAVSIDADPMPTRMWSGTRFRPAVDRKTDISIFEKMLAGKTLEDVIQRW